jgi:hypothetical protein
VNTKTKRFSLVRREGRPGHPEGASDPAGPHLVGVGKPHDAHLRKVEKNQQVGELDDADGSHDPHLIEKGNSFSLVYRVRFPAKPGSKP